MSNFLQVNTNMLKHFMNLSISFSKMVGQTRHQLVCLAFAFAILFPCIANAEDKDLDRGYKEYEYYDNYYQEYPKYHGHHQKEYYDNEYGYYEDNEYYNEYDDEYYDAYYDKYDQKEYGEYYDGNYYGK